VLREARHRGVGRLLYRLVSEHARELGRSELLTFSFEDDPDTVGFAARHGFTVAARTRGLRLPLADCPRPEVPPRSGGRGDHDARGATRARTWHLGSRLRDVPGHPIRR